MNKQENLYAIDRVLKNKFWFYVDVKEPDECWDWTGYVMKNGYGIFRFNEERFTVHRLAYMLDTGVKIDRDFLVLQLCGNKKCCNPFHFTTSTRKKQLEEMAENGTVRGYAQRGEKNHSAKLTNDQVIEIRRLFETGLYSKIKLGKMFSISDDEVKNLVKHRRWKWLK